MNDIDNDAAMAVHTMMSCMIDLQDMTGRSNSYRAVCRNADDLEIIFSNLGQLLIALRPMQAAE